MILRLLSLIPTVLGTRSDLALENLALRQQLTVLNRQRRRPKLRKLDRLFWVLLSRSCELWKEMLLIVKPETVLRWHRRRFASYWTRLSGSNGPGRPGKDREIDFFTVPTVTFRVLFVLIVLAHDRRKIAHFNVTEHPTAEWAAHQVIETVGDGKSPRYPIRDRDGVYGLALRDQVKALDIEEVAIAPHSPWQNPYAKRVIGTLRRECLNHVVVLGETHLRRIVRLYISYCHGARTHLALDKDTLAPRSVQPPDIETVIEIPEVRGLHHRYERRAA
jgi:putative transposase